MCALFLLLFVVLFVGLFWGDVALVWCCVGDNILLVFLFLLFLFLFFCADVEISLLCYCFLCCVLFCFCLLFFFSVVLGWCSWRLLVLVLCVWFVLCCNTGVCCCFLVLVVSWGMLPSLVLFCEKLWFALLLYLCFFCVCAVLSFDLFVVVCCCR